MSTSNKRPLLLTTFLAASAGLPYVMHHPTVQSLTAGLTGGATSEAPAESPLDPYVAPVVALDGTGGRVATRVTGPDARDLGEVFRFDIDESWVIGRWARVSTAAGEYGLRGLRAPLVTGTAQDDLAGAVTYYFDSRALCRKIAFQGTTGDPRKLLGLAAAYGLAPQYGESAAVTRYASPGPRGGDVLELTPAPVLAGNRPHERYAVTFILHRPAHLGEPAREYVEDRRTFTLRPQ
jgi:hypothetical protein